MWNTVGFVVLCVALVAFFGVVVYYAFIAPCLYAQDEWHEKEQREKKWQAARDRELEDRKRHPERYGPDTMSLRELGIDMGPDDEREEDGAR